ncbi:hypothetical protein ABBQ38_010456 [Trebouxia sp. C0009 RCD-2024]
MPYGLLPRTIDDSRDMYLVAEAIDTELQQAVQLGTGSAETLQQARQHLLELQLSLGQSLLYFRNPWELWLSGHPYWLDRIACVKACDVLQGPRVARPKVTEGEAALLLKYSSGGQALLQAYHASFERKPKP